jgi:hypothetical protein
VHFGKKDRKKYVTKILGKEIEGVAKMEELPFEDLKKFMQKK